MIEMDATQLLNIIDAGETSRVQFKETLPNPESMSRELVAMSNSLGGMILIGVKDTVGTVTGLTHEQIEYADRKVSEFADNLKPPIYLSTEVVKIHLNNQLKNVFILHVKEGTNKPYKTAQGEIYVKQGSDKRLLTDNAEIMRLFQNSGNLLADEMEVFGTSGQ